MFGRGLSAAQRNASTPVADIADLLLAYLLALRVPEHAERYAPPRPPLWRVQDAVARITHLLGEGVEGELPVFLPRVERNRMDYEQQCRAALAATLVAGLELCRREAVWLGQEMAWARIRIAGRGSNPGQRGSR